MPTFKQIFFEILHSSDIAAVRIEAERLAEFAAFDEDQKSRLAIIITELGTNILKHGDGGAISCLFSQQGELSQIHVVASDSGPGIRDLYSAMKDGESTTGTLGGGLGAIKRLTNHVEIFSQTQSGTVIYARLNSQSSRNESSNAIVAEQFMWGVINRPVAGEMRCGDSFAFCENAGGFTALVVDGLGHGPFAADAADKAVAAFFREIDRPLEKILGAMDIDLKPTRGAAVGISRYSRENKQLEFCGVGNINGSICTDETKKQFASHNGIVGNGIRKSQSFSANFPGKGIHILCSDGLVTQWDLARYGNLTDFHPFVIAHVLYRDFARAKDDCTVLVIKNNP